ncbi:MAG: lipoprotein, partial [Methylococcales bacterium]|nr:lipoprotein [Methylococcales bacterium]
LLGLQACGQTGPLYHPDEKAPIHVEDDEYE